MSTAAITPAVPRIARRPRAIAFRIAAGIIAVVFLFLFGSWRTVLAPWLALPDGADHGWQRTMELHVPADAASGILMLAISVATLVLVVRPLGCSTLVSWTACTLGLVSLGIAASTLVQGQAGVAGAALSGLVALALLVAPLVVLHPERRMILVAGGPSRQEGPTRPLTAAFALVGTAALVGAVAVVWWRISGGLFENPSEDDAISLAILGLSLAVGCALCARGRQGWRLLALLTAGVVFYCLMAGLTIAAL